MLFLDAAYVDALSDRLGRVPESWSPPEAIWRSIDELGPDLLDDQFVLWVLSQIAPSRRFAVIGTEYFGGVGGQGAALYDTSSDTSGAGAEQNRPINRALGALGVYREGQLDEFDSVRLGGYRQVEDFFKEYYE